MPFRPSDEIIEACDTLREEVGRLQRESRPFRGSGHIHEQVPVQTPSGPAEVDRGMVSLLQRLWEHGIDTHMSCEDNMGSTWICFDLHQFQRLHRLARSVDDLAYFVDNCHYTFTCQTPEHAAAEYCDEGEDEDDFAAGLPPLYQVNLRFPRRLHSTFEQLLDEARATADAQVAALRAERARASDRSRSPRRECNEVHRVSERGETPCRECVACGGAADSEADSEAL
jgi:hypothetical protein